MAYELLERYQPALDTPTAARRDLAAYLVGVGHRELIPVATVLVSELVTNSVVHASSVVTLRARWADDRLRVDVSDHGGGTPQARDVETSGRGLRIVDAFATRWGIDERFAGDGRSTWFELESC
jgi:anti-sigma regulatory factor (Ser/Thr protein kinase)